MSAATTGSSRVKRGLAEMLKGGVIMDVVTPDQAKIAEDAGAVAVMALERVPADIRAQGGVSRMSDPDMIDSIIDAVSIPVMAKARIGHFVEAQILQELGHVAEGVTSCESVLALASSYDVEMPLTDAVHRVCHRGLSVNAAVASLLGRSTKPE